jgi:hypothetical protein
MTTRKAPNSLKAAIERAAKPLGGLSNASLAIGRDRYTIPHAANPNRSEMLRLDDAIKLDQACFDAGGGTPILDHYEGAIEHFEGPRLSWFDHAANTVRESADLAAEIMDALKDGKISKSEKREIQKAIHDSQQVLSALAADLEAQ